MNFLKRSKFIPLSSKRLLWKKKITDSYFGDEAIVWAGEATANMIGSLCADGHHAPALDIDVPMRVVPSKTPGHHHLYFDVSLSWEQYKKLLSALEQCGIIETGYYKMSLRHGMTLLRRPSLEVAGMFGNDAPSTIKDDMEGIAKLDVIRPTKK